METAGNAIDFIIRRFAMHKWQEVGLHRQKDTRDIMRGTKVRAKVNFIQKISSKNCANQIISCARHFLLDFLEQ